MMAMDTDTRLEVNPMASAADNPFLRFSGNAGITISEPGSMRGFFLKIKNLRI
jgi:hypothetical protein